MKQKNCLLLILPSLFLFHQVKAPDVENVAELQIYLDPEKYTLDIHTDHQGDKAVLMGQVKIRVRCSEETKKVALNAKNMALTRDKIGITTVSPETRDTDTHIVSIADSYFAANKPDIYVIELTEPLKKDFSYDLSLPFLFDEQSEHPEVREQILYKNYMDDMENIDVLEIIIGNQAGLLFPCFLERNVKSRFKIIILHDANVVALSNWPVSKTENYQYRNSCEFEETEPMVPYGVSFALISFKSTMATSTIPIKIWANKESIKYMIGSKYIAETATLFYSKYFNVDLDSKKLDIIAVPKFHNVYTENIGLISLEESSLVLSEKDDQKYFDITSDLCYTLNRQWIGTTVTTANLNKHHFHYGLSLFLEQLCVNEVLRNIAWVHEFSSLLKFYDFRNFITFSRTLMPDYQMGLYSEFESALNYKLPKGDTQKALLLVRMLAFFLTENIFKESLQVYIEKFKHSFSNLENLWDIFTTEARKAKILDENITVEEIMENWINESTFPLIRVNVDYSRQIVTITQEPFKFLGDKDDEVEKVCWYIPLSYVSSGPGLIFLDDRLPKMLTCEKSETDFKLNSEEWITVNSQLHVLSHTYYDNVHWESIQKTLLNPETLYMKTDELTRARLILDLFALAENGIVPYKRVIDTMKYLKHEVSKLCWTVALIEFDKIYAHLLGATEELLDKFVNFVQEILMPVYQMSKNYEEITSSSVIGDQSVRLDDRLKKKNKSESLFDKAVTIDGVLENDRLKMEFKKLFIRSSCKFTVTICQTQSFELYGKWTTGTEDKMNLIIDQAPIEMVEVVLCEHIKYGWADDWNDLWKIYDKTVTSIKNDTILKALGCFIENEENILKDYLEKTLTESYPGDNLKAFRSLSLNKFGYNVMKEFLKNNYQNIQSHVREANNLLPQPIKMETYFVELFTITKKKEDMDDLMHFMETIISMTTGDNDLLNVSDELLQKSVKFAKKNILWLQEHQDTFSDLLQDYDLYFS